MNTPQQCPPAPFARRRRWRQRLAGMLLGLTLLPTLGLADGLDDPLDIDIVKVSGATGQVELTVVLDPDQPPADPSVLARLRKKLTAYRYYVTSGQVWKEARSNPRLPVVLRVVVTGALTPDGDRALASLRRAFGAPPTVYTYELLPPSPRQP